jgi:hypothetical protein
LQEYENAAKLAFKKFGIKKSRLSTSLLSLVWQSFSGGSTFQKPPEILRQMPQNKAIQIAYRFWGDLTLSPSRFIERSDRCYPTAALWRLKV